MTMRRFLGPVIAIAVLASAMAAPPARAADWTADEAAMRLGRGVNLGNALESPNTEGEWGMVIEDEYFALVAEAGFDSVRLPIRWDTRAGSMSPWTIESGFFARIDHLIDEALANDLAVIIDFHHFEDLYADPSANEDRFIALWRQIAERCASRPKEVFFELQNEPHDNLTTDVWEGIAANALAAIRESNPRRMVIIGPGMWNSAWELQNLDLPDDPALIATFHMYEPFQFTHQGAEWVGGSNAWLGTTWEGRPEDTQPILELMDLAEDFSSDTGLPVLMGEFGAYEKAPMGSRVAFNNYVREQAEARGFAWAYWEFGAGFGIYDRDMGLWKTELRDALIPPGSTSRPADDPFSDDDASEFEDDIEWLAESDITRGCNPPANTLFCPDVAVTRGQMAAFLTRALDLSATAANPFIDDDGSTFEEDITALAEAGVTLGCNPPSNSRFCPDDVVSRGQMSAFLRRALEGVLAAAPAVSFGDDDNSVFESDIEWLATTGVTRGCNPPTNSHFCPDSPVSRGQMAAFLHRALRGGPQP